MDNRLMFRDIGRQPLVSASGVLSVCAVAIVGLAIWKRVTVGTPLPPSVLSSPLMAVGVWASLQAELGWPDSSRRLFRRIGIAGVAVSALALAYGLWEWQWNGGSLWFPGYALACLVVIPLGWRRRMRRIDERQSAS